MKRYITLVFALLCAYTTHAQTGTIKGTIKDAKTGESIIGASVVLTGTATGSATDVEGNFVINKVPAGNQSVTISFVSYKPKQINDLLVQAGKTTLLNIALEEDVENLQEIVVTAARQRNTEVAVITEIREAQQVVSGISSEQIVKSQDRDASEVIRRIPGVTIMDNRFVMVRGLSERYNAVLLNDALTPSTENDVKAFSFDLIPSGMMDRMLIFKSAAPELPGEFAGGVIKIYTRTPLNNSFNIAYSSSFRDGTTFKDFYSQQRSSTEWLGFDNDKRTLPTDFPANINQVTSNEELTRVSKLLPNDWTKTRHTAIPDQRLALNLTRVFNAGANVKIGNITSVNYSYANQIYQASRYNYNAVDPISKQTGSPIYAFFDDTYINNVRLGVLHNWTATVNGNHKFEFRNLYNQLGSTQNTLRGGAEIEGGAQLQSYGYRYESRRIYMGQLHGEHNLANDKTRIEWSAGYANTKRDEPDFRRANTRRPINSSEGVPFEVTIPPGASNADASRFYSNAKENLFMASADWEQKLSKSDSSEQVPTLRAGFYVENKDRQFAARWMAYAKSQIANFNGSISRLPIEQIFSPENIDVTTGLVLREGTNPSDSYSGANLLMAGYVGTTLPLGKFMLSGGARVEQNNQELQSITREGQIISVQNNILRVLPSLNIAYNLSSKALFRLAYYRTLNRPELRELAPFSYYDFNFNNILSGNPNLKTPSIDNVDARLEFYPGEGETVSIGGFYKLFDNPIESYFTPGAGSGGTRNFTFENADYSTSVGGEIEVRKSLRSLTTSPFLGNFSLLLNASFIRSRVELGDRAVGQSNNRPMMGQSPYAINTGIYYSNQEQGVQVNILYNVFGKRIYGVGTVGTPDIYELPRNILDITLTKNLGKSLELRLGVQDLLNNATLLRQDSNADGVLTRTSQGDDDILNFKRGAYYTAGLVFRIQ